MVGVAKAGAALLAEEGISARVLDMYCVKPLDAESIVKAAKETGHIITIEEHGPIGGLSGMVAQVLAENCPVPMKAMTLPDSPVVAGKSAEIFAYYGLTADGVRTNARRMLGRFGEEKPL